MVAQADACASMGALQRIKDVGDLWDAAHYPKPVPSPPDDNDDDRDHEQYKLVATRTGMYPVLVWGKTDPVGTVKLKKGDVWKYGTTVNPGSRYTQKWLREMHLLKIRQVRGTRRFVLIHEAIKLIKYFIEHGKLPPGNKAFK